MPETRSIDVPAPAARGAVAETGVSPSATRRPHREQPVPPMEAQWLRVVSGDAPWIGAGPVRQQ